MENFQIFWLNLPSQISPFALQVGAFSVRWYSLSYLAAFLTVYLLLRWRIKKGEGNSITPALLDEMMIWGIIGLLLGARLGYALFYDFGNFIANPFSIIWPFGESGFGFFGMSFHGGLLGALLGFWLFSHKRKINFWSLADFVIPAIPLGYFFGRIGNFLNGELFGRETDLPWGMIFPIDSEGVARHPSQLYEALGEGLLLFAILWPLRNHPKLKHKFFGLFLVLYGLVRFLVEFVRQPDPQLGFILWHLTMGQILSLMMVIVGVFLLKTTKATKSD